MSTCTPYTAGASVALLGVATDAKGNAHAVGYDGDVGSGASADGVVMKVNREGTTLW